MAPANSKSLLAFIFDQMEKLNRNEITAEQACAQAKLASQASNQKDEIKHNQKRLLFKLLFTAKQRRNHQPNG